MEIIMLSAKQGGGKSTLTQKLISNINRASSLKFADVIYEIHDGMWDILDKYDVIPREKKASDFLQYLGTEFGRKRHPEIWVKCAQSKSKLLEKAGALVLVVDDCRFENEFMAFDGVKIRLECHRDIRKQRAESWREDEVHDSEISLDSFAAQGKFDYYIDTGSNDIATVMDEVWRVITKQEKGRGAFESIDFRNKFYDPMDIEILPKLKQHNKELGKKAYQVLNLKKAGHLAIKEADQQIQNILHTAYGAL